jgi:hypothetical protein
LAIADFHISAKINKNYNPTQIFETSSYSHEMFHDLLSPGTSSGSLLKPVGFEPSIEGL